MANSWPGPAPRRPSGVRKGAQVQQPVPEGQAGQCGVQAGAGRGAVLLLLAGCARRLCGLLSASKETRTAAGGRRVLAGWAWRKQGECGGVILGTGAACWGRASAPAPAPRPLPSPWSRVRDTHRQVCWVPGGGLGACEGGIGRCGWVGPVSGRPGLWKCLCLPRLSGLCSAGEQHEPHCALH